MNEDIEKLKKLTINVLQEEHDNHMENKKQLKDLVISIFLTILPIFIFIITPGLADKYFHVFSDQDHYFRFSPTFVLDLPYFLPPIIWALALWFCLKMRKQTQDRKSFFNYFTLVLLTFNGIFMLYSLWFILVYFI